MTAGGKESGKGEEDRADREGEGGMRASAVLGTTSARSVISMRPAGAPPMVMSKKTTGLDMVDVRKTRVMDFVVVANRRADLQARS